MYTRHVLETHRDEYEALFGKGTGPLILARTDSLITDGFGKHRCNSSFIICTYNECRTNLCNQLIIHRILKRMLFNDALDSVKLGVI